MKKYALIFGIGALLGFFLSWMSEDSLHLAPNILLAIVVGVAFTLAEFSFQSTVSLLKKIAVVLIGFILCFVLGILLLPEELLANILFRFSTGFVGYYLFSSVYEQFRQKRGA